MTQDQQQRVLKRFQSVLPFESLFRANSHNSNSASIDEETPQSQDSVSTSHSSHVVVNDTQSDAYIIARLILFHHTLLTLYVTGFRKTVLNRTFCISRNINLKY